MVSKGIGGWKNALHFIENNSVYVSGTESDSLLMKTFLPQQRSKYCVCVNIKNNVKKICAADICIGGDGYFWYIDRLRCFVDGPDCDDAWKRMHLKPDRGAASDFFGACPGGHLRTGEMAYAAGAGLSLWGRTYGNTSPRFVCRWCNLGNMGIYCVPVIGFALLIINACYGAGFSVIPAILADHYGMNNISKIHGAVLSAWGFAGLAGNQAAILVKDKWGYGYTGVIFMLVLAYLLNLANAVILKKQQLK